MTRITFALIAMPLLAVSASAQTYIPIVSNSGAEGSASFNTAGTRFDQQFTTGSMAGFGDSDGNGIANLYVSLNLEAGKVFDYIPTIDDFDYRAGYSIFRLCIRADTAGAPGGAVLGPYGDINTDATGVVTFNMGTEWLGVLQPHTTYWLEILWLGSTESMSIAPLLYTTTAASDNGAGTLGALLRSNDGSSWDGMSARANIQISGEGVTPVPEPSTYGLAIGGLALAAAGLQRRRR